MSLPSLVALPTSLQPLVTHAEETFLDALRDTSEQAEQLFSAWSASRREAFGRVCAASDFVSEQVSRDPEMLLQLAESGLLERSLKDGEMRAALTELLGDCTDEDSLARRLRRFRNRQQVRIARLLLPRPAAICPTWLTPVSTWRTSGYTSATASSLAFRLVDAAAMPSTWLCLAWASWAHVN